MPFDYITLLSTPFTILDKTIERNSTKQVNQKQFADLVPIVANHFILIE